MRQSSVKCPGPMSRRSFMKIGGFSLGALAGGASFHLSELLAAQDAAPTVANSPFYGGGPAFLGSAYVPFMFRGDPANASYSVGDLTVSQAAAAQLHRRSELLNRFDTLRREIDRSETMSALDRFNRRAVEMLTSTRTRQAFDIAKEPDRVRDRYTRTTGGQSLLLARRLVEAGVRFVEITAHNPVRPSSGVVG